MTKNNKNQGVPFGRVPALNRNITTEESAAFETTEKVREEMVAERALLKRKLAVAMEQLESNDLAARSLAKSNRDTINFINEIMK
jgi:hypothetical protein